MASAIEVMIAASRDHWKKGDARVRLHEHHALGEQEASKTPQAIFAVVHRRASRVRAVNNVNATGDSTDRGRDACARLFRKGRLGVAFRLAIHQPDGTARLRLRFWAARRVYH